VKKSAIPNTPHVPARMLNVRQAAEYLGATIWFIRTLGWEGKVPFVKAGRRLLFDVRDLDAFIEREKVAVLS